MSKFMPMHRKWEEPNWGKATVAEVRQRAVSAARGRERWVANCRVKIGIEKRIREPDHPDTVTAVNNIVDALYREHRYSEAAAILGQAVDAEQSVLGTDHLHTFHSLQ
jgi:hypothetical protein